VVKWAGSPASYAKPRSSTLDAFGLPSYRGDMINAIEATLEARTPDPTRMVRAYANAAADDMLARSPTAGLADLHAVA